MSGVPGPVGKFVALFFTPLYLMLLAIIMARVTDHELHTAMVVIVAGAAVVTYVIINLSSRFSKQGTSRFSISSLMMITVALAVYLAYIRQLLGQIPSDLKITVFGFFVFLGYCFFFILISTIILIRFADALVSVATWLLSIVKVGQK